MNLEKLCNDHRVTVICADDIMRNHQMETARVEFTFSDKEVSGQGELTSQGDGNVVGSIHYAYDEFSFAIEYLSDGQIKIENDSVPGVHITHASQNGQVTEVTCFMQGSEPLRQITFKPSGELLALVSDN